jgi:hypothetical protein
VTLSASCLCGATRYELSGPVNEVVLCHCGQCRRANGGAFNVAVLADVADVRFGARDRIREYESSPGKYRAFCSGCGSPVYSRRDDLPAVLRLRGGLIDDLPAPGVLIVSHRADGWGWLDQGERGVARATAASGDSR